jgi:hypothetical protein
MGGVPDAGAASDVLSYEERRVLAAGSDAGRDAGWVANGSSPWPGKPRTPAAMLREWRLYGIQDGEG